MNTFLKKHLQSVVVVGLLVPLLFVGCAPPSVKMVDSGHPIFHVKDHAMPPYQTVYREGVDYLQSPFPVGRFGGTFYNSSIGHGPKTLNPLVASDATSSQIGDLMFSGLTGIDAYTGKTNFILAKSVDVKPDNVTYIVTLRRGLVWSDGQPITADDVVFTWNDIVKQGLGNPSTRDVIMVNGKLPEVTKLDNLTIQFKTPGPFAPFEQNLSTPILPKHIVAPIIRGNARAFDSLWGVSAPASSFVTSGPFVLEQYISGQRVILKRNPHYFFINTAGQRLPYMDRYVIEFVQDQNAEVLQFEQGHIDALGVPGNMVFYIKHLTSPDFKMYDLGPTTASSFLVFNQNPRKRKTDWQPYVNPIQSAWFRDLNFRRAVDLAIDREKMVQNILMGVGAPLFTEEPLSSVYLNKKLAQGHPQDIEKAKAYLKASGFHWNEAGQLLDKGDHLVEFELNTNAGNLDRESTAVAIKQDLAQLGMKVDTRSIEFNVLVGRLDTSDWESMIMGLTGSPLEPHGGKNVWTSTGALHLFNQRHADRDLPGTDKVDSMETQLDTLYNAGASTLDVNKRHQIYDDVQQVIYDNLPVIYLYSPKQILAVRSHIQNFDPTPLDAFHNLESLWVK